METVTVACNLCGQKNYTKIFVIERFSICQCRNCCLVFVNPQPTEKALNNYYNDQYTIDFKLYQKQVFKKSRRLLNLIERFTNKDCLLEIGCSYGSFLKIARGRGWKVRGVEISPLTSHFARKEYNLPVTTASIRNINFTQKEFDAIVMWHVLEHDRDPRGLFKKIYQYLQPNGILALTLPNINSFSARILGRYWLNLLPPAHLYQFSPLTIKRMLENSGFQIILLKTNHGDSPNIFFNLLQGLKNKILGQDSSPAHPAKGDNKSQLRWLRLYRLMNLLTTPPYILCYPIIWILWRLGMGDEILVLAQKAGTSHSTAASDCLIRQ